MNTMKPRITPYRRHDRPGKWRCYSYGPGCWPKYEGTGYTPADAYQKWLNAVTCLVWARSIPSDRP